MTNRFSNKNRHALLQAVAFGFILVAAIAAWLHARRFSFVCDDAYISFRYAQNLARHGVLEWNVGERVEGFTNFLWTVFLAAAIKLGFSPESASLFMGRLMGSAGVFLLFVIQIITYRNYRNNRNNRKKNPISYKNRHSKNNSKREPKNNSKIGLENNSETDSEEHSKDRLKDLSKRHSRSHLRSHSRNHPGKILHPALFLGPFIVACTGAYACWSSGGLETTMFTGLSLAGFALYLWEESHAKKIRLSGIIMALAAMTRPEGVLLFACMGGHRFVFSLLELWKRSKRSSTKGKETEKPLGIFLEILKRESIWAAGFVVVYGGYFLWRYNYFGYLFPNTYYIKSSSPNPEETWNLGVAYLESFIRDYGLKYLSWVPLVGVVLSIRNALRREGSYLPLFTWTYFLAATIALGILTVKVGGDFMAMHRFWVPVIPFLAFMIADTIRQIGDLLEEIFSKLPRSRSLKRFKCSKRFQSLGWISAWSFCGLAGIIIIFGLSRRSYRLGEKSLNTLTVTKTGYHGSYDGKESVAFMDRFARDRVLIGRWLKKRVPKDSWMAVGGAGAIVYASELNAIDSFGLADLYVAHEVKPRSSRPGHQKLAPMDYILSREPDIICTPQVTRMMDWEFRPPKRVRRRWERHGYQYFCATPYGLKPSHYCCLMRVDKNLGLTPVSAYQY